MKKEDVIFKIAVIIGSSIFANSYLKTNPVMRIDKGATVSNVYITNNTIYGDDTIKEKTGSSNDYQNALLDHLKTMDEDRSKVKQTKE